MTWVLLSVGAATFYALQGAWSKRLTRTVSDPVATWAIFAFSFPLLLAWLVLEGLPETGPRFPVVLAVNTALYVLSFRLYVSALGMSDLGLTYPLLALTPVLVVPVEWILTGRGAGLRGSAGILLVAAGVYVLNYRGGRGRLLEPFRALAGDAGARRMGAVAALWAVSGTLDRVAVLDASPALYGVCLSGLMTAAFLLPALRAREREGPVPGGVGPSRDRGRPTPGGVGPAPAAPPKLALGASLRRRPGALAVQGLLFAAMFVVQMEALRLALAAYVLAIKRSGTLLSVLMGGLWFGEKRTGLRLAGTAVMLAGVVLVSTS